MKTWQLLLVGIGIILLSLRRLLQYRRLQVNGRPAIATVVCNEKQRMKRGSTNVNYFPRLRYSVDGREHTVLYHSGDTEPKYAPGQTVQIRYEEGDPENIQIKGDRLLPVFLVIMMLFGLVLACASGYISLSAG